MHACSARAGDKQTRVTVDLNIYLYKFYMHTCVIINYILSIIENRES